MISKRKTPSSSSSILALKCIIRSRFFASESSSSSSAAAAVRRGGGGAAVNHSRKIRSPHSLESIYLKYTGSSLSAPKQNFRILKLDSLDIDTKHELAQTARPDVVPTLKHGLEKVLDDTIFHPYPHVLPKSFLDKDDFSARHTPFPPVEFLNTITHPNDVDLSLFPPYVIASKDDRLKSITAAHNTRYYTSTSSITDFYAKIWLFLGIMKKVEVHWGNRYSELTHFTTTARAPTSIILKNNNDGTFSIDRESPPNATNETILLRLGNSMEKMAVLEPSEFEKLKKSYTGPPLDLLTNEEPYNYSKFGKFMFRSQIDCRSDKIGGYFDIKTRATYPIRMDVGNYHKYTSYRIKCIEGKSHSWTREYNDMIRSLFIKWSLQGRLGFMKGMFVWYHSTDSSLGFQYIPMATIHEKVFGSVAVADDAFHLGFKMMEQFFDDLLERFPGKKFRLTVRSLVAQKMDIFVETADLNETFEEAKEKSMVSKGSEKYPENLYLYELFNSSTINGMLTNDISYHGSGNQWAMECLINESSMSPMKLYQQYKDTRRSCKNLASVMPVIDRTMKRTLGRLMSEQGVGATDRNVEDAAGGDEFSEFEDLLDDDEDDHDDSVVRVIEFK